MDAPSCDYTKVFIVHGRNLRARDATVQFLHALHSDPLTWEQAVALTGKAAPTTLEVVSMGLRAACAIVVLLTPDEQAQLREQFVESGRSSQPGFQPRPNVIFEAGMALALEPNRTIIVRLGQVREISDLAGINYIQLSNAPESRRALALRLQRTGCNVDLTGDYLNPRVAGDFDFAVGKPTTQIPSESRRLIEVQIVGRDAIFHGGCEYLKEKSRGEVMIYAPTGVWAHDPAKADWLSTIAGCLAKGLKVEPPSGADRNVTTTLGNFIGVFGLPPVPRSETPKAQDDFAKALDFIENLFLPFNELETAHIYYLEVDTRTIPGTGVITIDDSALFIGFAVTGRHKVDYGLFLRDQRDITAEVRKWFNYHVMAILDFGQIVCRAGFRFAL